MSRPARAVVALLAAAAGAVAPVTAAAQTYRGVPPNGTSALAPSTPRRSSPPPSSPRSPAPATPAARRGPPVHVVAYLGYDLGGSGTLLREPMTDGSTRAIGASQGVDLSVGLAFLELLGGRLATQATVGVEGWSIGASNGSARWLAYSLDLMEFGYLDPLRFGLGLSYLLAPRLSGSGVLSARDVSYRSSPGLAFEADYVARMTGSSRGARFTLGVRYVRQELEERSGASAVPGRTHDASSFAILLGFTG